MATIFLAYNLETKLKLDKGLYPSNQFVESYKDNGASSEQRTHFPKKLIFLMATLGGNFMR
jgi:hypothetical protein